VGDVADRIVDLALVERPPSPVGEARALVEAVADQALDEVRIADLLAEPQSHRRDLRVEDRVRGPAGQIVDDLDVLAAGVEDLQDLLIVDQQVEQGLEVDPLGLGVDRGRFLLVADLDQAEVGPIGVLAHELGVDGDEVGLGKPFAQGLKRFGIGDQRMDVHCPRAIAAASALDKANPRREAPPVPFSTP
jgi:hypothetical protein